VLPHQPSRAQPSRAQPGRAQRWLLPIFLVLAVPGCLLFGLLVPPGHVADEPHHLLRAASLLDGQLIGHRAPLLDAAGRSHIVVGVSVDPALFAASTFLPSQQRRLAPGQLDAARAIGWTGRREFFPLYTIATYLPVFYLPAAAGLGVAEAMGASPYNAIMGGRLAQALAYLALGAAALLLARQGRALIAAGLLLPMSLSMAPSFNQDALIIAGSLLAAALLTRGTGAARGGAALLLALVIAVKPPYAPLAVALLLPLPGFGAWRAAAPRLLGRLGLAVLVCLPALLWVALVMRDTATPIPRPAYAAGPLWPGPWPAEFAATDPAAQLRVLLAQPLRLLTLPLDMFAADRGMQGVVIAAGMVGLLGWQDVLLPLWVYPLWALALLGAAAVPGHGAAAPGRGAAGAPWLAWALLGLAALAAVWGICLSQYLSWTNVGYARIEGPQGRYLIPLLALLVVAPPVLPRLAPGWRPALAWLPLLAALLALLALPGHLLATYQPP
jgi:hypothetical protein